MHFYNIIFLFKYLSYINKEDLYLFIILNLYFILFELFYKKLQILIIFLNFLLIIILMIYLFTYLHKDKFDYINLLNLEYLFIYLVIKININNLLLIL